MNKYMKNLPILAVVVPCYKEEPVLADTTRRLTAILQDMINLQEISDLSRIVYVNDGSSDRTWPIIAELHAANNLVSGINLAHNVGHQNALMAGLTTAVEKADLLVTIDADLQDDPEAIRMMVKMAGEGKDIVYGVRAGRQSDSWFKRTTAQGFYRFMEWLGVPLVYNHADYRLMSNRATRQLLSYRERNLFLRGIVPQIGYQTDCVYFDRVERQAGESKYPLGKMLSFAWDGITSFSVKPIRLLLHTGALFVLISLGIAVWAIYNYCIGHVVQGWTSLILSVWFCSGVILLGMGILGEYIGKIYTEVKDRPRFNIEQVLWE